MSRTPAEPIAERPFAERMTSRKFWLVVALGAISVALLVGGFIQASHWVGVTQWILTVYVAGNVIQKIGGA